MLLIALYISVGTLLSAETLEDSITKIPECVVSANLHRIEYGHAVMESTGFVFGNDGKTQILDSSAIKSRQITMDRHTGIETESITFVGKPLTPDGESGLEQSRMIIQRKNERLLSVEKEQPFVVGHPHEKMRTLKMTFDGKCLPLQEVNYHKDKMEILKKPSCTLIKSCVTNS